MLQGEHSAILLTFIKLPFVIKTFVLSIFEWPFYTGFTVCCKLHITWVFHKHSLLFHAFKFPRMPPGAVMNFENPQTPQAFPNPVSPASSYGGTMASVAPKNDLG